eukprot:GABV01000813.1.p1 GENE.GABV01000813.1~~GABV01000813.1.p1  ORF type:complete len:260 (+),score=66.22 GABV01000813.1:167-946(+)
MRSSRPAQHRQNCSHGQLRREKFDLDYIATLGVHYLDRQIRLKNFDVVLSIWDIGGELAYADLVVQVASTAHVLVFVFDLVNSSSLSALTKWYSLARQQNKKAPAVVVGTKFDLFMSLNREDQEFVINKSKKFARAMKAPLIFSSAKTQQNIQSLFRIVLHRALRLPISIKPVEHDGSDKPLIYLEPLLARTPKGGDRTLSDGRDNAPDASSVEAKLNDIAEEAPAADPGSNDSPSPLPSGTLPSSSTVETPPAAKPKT